jgi:hypothetical protein
MSEGEDCVPAAGGRQIGILIDMQFWGTGRTTFFSGLSQYGKLQLEYRPCFKICQKWLSGSPAQMELKNGSLTLIYIGTCGETAYHGTGFFRSDSRACRHFVS